MQSQTEKTKMKKPIPLRIIFILNGILMLLSYVFYTVFTIKGIDLDGVDKTSILYTAFGYTFLFAVIVFSILRKYIWLLRISILLIFIISIPTSAYIGFIISAITFVLSFHKKVQDYFNH